jgi:WD40 repeat protein
MNDNAVEPVGEQACKDPASKRSRPAIPDHEVLCRIGAGSYGEVWLAKNAVGSWRAVKVVYRNRFNDPRPYERELIGIRKYEPISRANEGLVDVLQIGRNDAEGYFYYVMELADDSSGDPGPQSCNPVDRPSLRQNSAALAYRPKTLAAEIKARGRLPVEECLRLGITLCLALGHLHRQGLIHRDVKPSNIIFVNGVPKLADIGLVTDVSEARSFVGTEGFIPPEGPNSPQADLYAMGKVLYEASVGKDRNEFPAPPSGLGLDADSRKLMELNAVVLRACAANPRERYQSAEKMNADLALLNGGESVRDKHALERRLKLTQRVAAGIAALMVLGAFPYYLVIREAHRATIAETRATESLWNSLRDQAHALRWSGRPGRRFEALRVIEEAAAIRPCLELRNEAIACMALSDARVTKTWAYRPDARIMAFDDTCKLYALLETNGLIHIRRTEDDANILTISGLDLPGPESVADARISLDGRFALVASGPRADRVEIWNLEKKQRMNHFDGRRYRSAAFSPDSRRLALSLRENDDKGFPIITYDLVQNRVFSCYDHDELPNNLRFHPSKELLAISSWAKTDVLIWNYATGRILERLPHPGHVAAVDWRPDGQELAAPCSDSNLYLWDFTSPEPPQRGKSVLSGHERAVTWAHYSLDGAYLFSGGPEGTLRIWDNKRRVQVLAVPESALSPGHEIIPRNNRGYTIPCAAPDHMALVEFQPSSEYRLLGPELSLNHAEARSCAFDAQSTRLLTTHADGMRVWDVPTGQVLGFQAEDGLWFGVFEPTSSKFLTGGGEGIKEWECPVENGERHRGLKPRRVLSAVNPRALAMSRDGGQLAFCADKGLHIITLSTGNERLAFEMPLQWPTLAFGEGQMLAVVEGKFDMGSVRPTAPLWILDCQPASDPKPARVIRELSVAASGLLCFSPDGRHLMVGDKAAYWLCDTGRWETKYSIEKPRKSVSGRMSFSPDGSIVAIAADHDMVKLIEVSSDRELASIQSNEACETVALDFSPDGRHLAIACGSGPIQIWDLQRVRKQLAALGLDWGQPTPPRLSAGSKRVGTTLGSSPVPPSQAPRSLPRTTAGPNP